jgi:hypothetical protein
MKRLAFVVSLVLVFAAGGVAALNFWPNHATAQDGDRVIPVRVTEFTEYERAETGGRCSFYLDILTYFNAHLQIVVKNETGVVIGIADLEDGVYEDGAISGHTCVLEFDLQVPQAKFYTVYLGESRISGFSSDQFPLEWDQAIWITL